MKKRINDNEIDSARKSSKALFIVCFLFLIVTVSLIALYIIYGGKLLNENDEQIVISNNNDKKSDKKDSRKVSINADDNNIVRLFDVVRITNNTCEGYDIQDNVLVNDMSIKCRLSLASNIYSDSVRGDNSYTYIPEVAVKDAYNSLFGYNSYEVVETIPYKNSSLYYNISDKYYFTQNEILDPDTPLVAYEKIIDAYREDDYLYINSVSLYYEGINKVFCRDARCEEVVDNVTTEPNYPDYYSLYVDSKAEKLAKYTYKFKLNEAGFYNYVGYEKTK